ncbi:MAG: DUF2304 domain-containing protein [Erysipelotrichia bacterium]|nr:DUF2304 domain-containing protein [Erysipelotrichia bacterium]
MLSTMQTSLLMGSVITLIFVLVVAKRTRMNIHYTIIWIVWALIIIILSLFPKLIDWIARVLSIATPVNAVFLVFIFLVYLISFYLFVRVSQQNEKIRTLTYEIAELKRRLQDHHD